MPRLLAAVTMALAALILPPSAIAAPGPDAPVFTWTDPTAIATGLTNAADPVLAYTPGGVQNAVWQADGNLYYSAQKPGQAWGVTSRIAAGTSPAVTVDTAGQLHVVFANSFQGNWEIYHIRLLANGLWTFPRLVSRTTGPSVQPVLVADKVTGLHAAWMDHIGQDWLVYLGAWNGGVWSSYPVTTAVGKDPALAVMDDGAIALAWQRFIQPLDDPGGHYEIFSSERIATGWSIPVNVSARPGKLPVDATGVSAVAGPDNRVHLTWQEGERDIFYDFGRGMYWPSPVLVASSTAVARGPHLVVKTEGMATLAWDEGESIRVASAPAGSTSWPPAKVLVPPSGDQRDVTLVATSSGLTLGWVQTSDGISTIYESRLVQLSSADMPVKVRIPFISN